jgi:hypothetical protein
MSAITVYYTDYKKLVSHCTELFADLKMAKVSFLYGSHVQFFFNDNVTSVDKNSVLNKIQQLIISAPSENKFHPNADGFRFFANNTLKHFNGIDPGLIIYEDKNGMSKDTIDFLSLVDNTINEAIGSGESNFFVALKMCLSVLVQAEQIEFPVLSNKVYLESMHIIKMNTYAYDKIEINEFLNNKEATYSEMLHAQSGLLDYLSAVKEAMMDNSTFDEPWLDSFIDELPKHQDVYNSLDKGVNTLILLANKLNICDDQLGYLFFLIKSID